MRILHLAAGAGTAYCGACARDMVMARGLVGRGHDVQIVPLYTPLKIEGEEPCPIGETYLGGINAWLQQHVALCRRMPAALDRVLDHPALLGWAAKFAVSTKPAQLGPMTVSVLAGRDGRQAKEVARLIEYLRTQEPPEIISLTNSLLSGLAPALKQEFDVPIVCGLQGEESFVAGLPERYRQQAQDLMQANARQVDLFLAPGEAYAAEMAAYLGVPREQVAVARPGIETGPLRRSGPRPTEPFTIGYLSVIIPRKGLDLLVAAWIRLLQEWRPDVRLRVAGAALDRGYLREIRRTIERAGLAERCEFLGQIEPAEKIAFLHGCSVFAVPSRFAESRGTAIMEAIAAGVPVVAPNAGIYPELFGLIGGGLLHEVGEAESVAGAIRRVMDDAAGADAMAERGREGLEEECGAEVTARRLEELFAEAKYEV
jgi:glycosyltransferase involved in cell wall biosynthesis